MNILFFYICSFLTCGSAVDPGKFSNSSLTRYAFSQPHMGTMFNIVLYDNNPEHAEKAVTAAFAKIDSLNMILSDYVPESELNRLSCLSGSDEFVKTSSDLFYVLIKSKDLSEKTEGAFDVTIGPLIRLWRRAIRQQEFPEEVKIQEALSRVGSEHMILNADKSTVKLMVKGMQLDVGAIGKGYALDEAMKVLKQYGIKSALVDGGGDVLVSDPPPGEKGWKIEINRGNADTAQKYILLKNKAIATSGDTYKYIVNKDKKYSHIINPVDGMGMTNRYLVSVLADDGILADGLASALVVLGPAGFKNLKAYKDAAALIISHPSEIHYTKNFKNYLIK